jgi:hypothetical protein
VSPQKEEVMKHRLATLAAVAAVAGAGAFASVPAQAGNVSWGVSIGVPGFGIYAGAPAYYGYGYGYRPYVRPYAPVYAPVYAPAPVYYGPRVVYPAPYRYYRSYAPYYAPAPVYRPPVVYRPYY